MVSRVYVADRDPDDVLVVGATGFDDIIMPEDSRERVLGGAAIFAALAARLFAPVYLESVVGYDFNNEYLNAVKKAGVDVLGVSRDQANRTFYWKSEYAEDFKSRTVLAKSQNSFSNYRPQLSEEKKKIAFVAITNQDPEFQLHIVNQLNAEAFIAIDTIKNWIESSRDRLLEVIGRCSLLCINEEEARALSREAKLDDAAHYLRELGLGAVIIKHGAEGSVLYHENGQHCVDSVPIEKVVDPTGAGDTYMGALVGCLGACGVADFNAIRRAMSYASAVASITVESFSCEGIIKATPEIVMERYEKLGAK